MNQAVSHLFLSAIELEPTERCRYLAEAVVPEAVRALAARLVAAHERAGDFLERTVEAGFELLSSRTGQRLGPYQLTERLAEGGMGEVYRASYSGDSKCPVVIKLLKKSLVRARERETMFEREGRLLNQLRHPNIVSLHHRGTAEDGSTYLAMAYVPGTTLTAYARKKGLDLRQKLGLFRALCRPVNHCHAHGVIHCDLKPENILVDESGAVTLIDFGIAQEIGATTGERVPFTLPYASPEQIKGGQLSVATDIHALGIMLYQLICDELPCPSRAQIAQRTALLEHRPDLDPQQLKKLPSLLARVISLCIKPDPAARFASVSNLLQALALVEAQLRPAAKSKVNQGLQAASTQGRVRRAPARSAIQRPWQSSQAPQRGGAGAALPARL